MRLGIARIEYELGGQCVTNEQLKQERPDWDMDAITAKTGVRARHVSIGETPIDLGLTAARRVLDGVDALSVDCLVAITSTSDVAFPGVACFLQHKLGLGGHVFAFDINLGCSGFTYGYITLAALAHSGVISCPLLVCTDTYTRFIGAADRAARPIFSDAACATLFGEGTGLMLVDYDFGTDGGGANDLVLRSVSGNRLRQDPVLHMDGAKVLMFTMSKVPESVRNIMSRQMLKPEDIDLFVFHQASKVVLDNLQRTLRLPPERVYRNLENLGNTVSCTIPICLKQILDSKHLPPNALLLISGFGVGLSWATCLLRVA